MAIKNATAQLLRLRFEAAGLSDDDVELLCNHGDLIDKIKADVMTLRIMPLVNDGFVEQFTEMYTAKRLGIDRYQHGYYRACSDELARTVLYKLELREVRRLHDLYVQRNLELRKLRQLHNAYIQHEPIRWSQFMKHKCMPRELRDKLDRMVAKTAEELMVKRMTPIVTLVDELGVDLPLSCAIVQTLGNSTVNAINRGGVVNLVELTKIPEEDFAQWRQIGDTALSNVKALLHKHGLAFAPS